MRGPARLRSPARLVFSALRAPALRTIHKWRRILSRHPLWYSRQEYLTLITMRLRATQPSPIAVTLAHAAKPILTGHRLRAMPLLSMSRVPARGELCSLKRRQPPETLRSSLTEDQTLL